MATGLAELTKPAARSESPLTHIRCPRQLQGLDHVLRQARVYGGYRQRTVHPRRIDRRLRTHPETGDLGDALGNAIGDAAPTRGPDRQQWSPGASTSAGVMLLRARLPGWMEFTRPGTGSNHIIPLFITISVPEGTNPDRKLAIKVLVSQIALPSASIAQMCVVPASNVGALPDSLGPAGPSSNAHGSPERISGTRPDPTREARSSV